MNLPLISNSFSLFTKPLGTILSAPATIGITIILLFHYIFSFQAKSIFVLPFIFRLWFVRMAKSIYLNNHCSVDTTEVSLFRLSKWSSVWLSPTLKKKYLLTFSFSGGVHSELWEFGWLVGWLIVFYCLSTFASHLMPNPVYIHTCIICKWIVCWKHYF